MNTYQIWIEGYSIQGERGTAQFIGTFDGHDFADAVRRFYATHRPNCTTFDAEHLNDWGCRFFDNEADARRTFG